MMMILKTNFYMHSTFLPLSFIASFFFLFQAFKCLEKQFQLAVLTLSKVGHAFLCGLEWRSTNRAQGHYIICDVILYTQ